MYVQDTWKVTRNFTVTARPAALARAAGLRGERPAGVHQHPARRTGWPSAQILADQGLSQSGRRADHLRSRRVQGRPHVSVPQELGAARSAWPTRPKAESGLSKFLFGGPGKDLHPRRRRHVLRRDRPAAGADVRLLLHSDLPSSLTSPPNILTTAQAPRLHGVLHGARRDRARRRPRAACRRRIRLRARLFAITNSIDDKLKAPYTINLDFSIGREFGHGFFIQGSYVGRLSRHSLVQQRPGDADQSARSQVGPDLLPGDDAVGDAAGPAGRQRSPTCRRSRSSRTCGPRPRVTV